MLHSPRWRLFLVLLFAFVLLIAILWWINNRRKKSEPALAVDRPSPSNTLSTQPTYNSSPVSAAQPSSPISMTSTPTPKDDPAVNPSEASSSFIGHLKLIIPVAGVKEDQLTDTFADARSEGRVHDAIDIPAPQGTAVLAAADGEIIKLFQSERGGTTIYQLSMDHRIVFYYAHLQRYADGIAEGMHVQQGQVIAYVGDTGNAGTGNFHLHFSIAIVADPKRYWEGTNIDPYPLLRSH